MALSNSIKSVQIGLHQNGFGNQYCYICYEDKILEPAPELDGTKFWEKFSVRVISSGPTTKSLFSDKDVVHLDCHIDVPYHYKCLERWLKTNSSCPMERAPVDLESAFQKIPAIDDRTPLAIRKHQSCSLLHA